MEKAVLKNGAEGRGGDKLRTALGLVQQGLDSAPGGERGKRVRENGLYGNLRREQPNYGVDMPENVVFIL